MFLGGYIFLYGLVGVLLIVVFGWQGSFYFQYHSCFSSGLESWAGCASTTRFEIVDLLTVWIAA